MLDKVRKKQIATVANIVSTEERSRLLTFTDSYFSTNYIIVTRRSEQGVNSMYDLNGRTVAVEKDFFLHPLLAKDFQEIKLLLVDSTLAALEAVAEERADAYIGNQAVAVWLMEENLMTNLKIAGHSGFPPQLLRFGVRRDWPELVSLLNKGLASISEDEHKAIRQKWVGALGTRQAPLPRLLLTPEELSGHQWNLWMKTATIREWRPSMFSFSRICSASA